MDELDSWKEYVDNIYNEFDHNSGNCYMICGGKNTGKSTFVKYFINRLLSLEKIDVVGCIDLDPGQPEFSLPGNLSFSTFSSPLPILDNREIKFCYKKEILFGTLSPVESFLWYYEITEILREESKRFNMPIIVNTTGHTRNAGKAIIVSLIRIIKPSHVVNLISKFPSVNFQIPLISNSINSEPKGYSNCENVVVNFDGVKLSAYRSQNTLVRDRKRYRELQILNYLTQFLKVDAKMCWIKDEPIEIPFNNCAIHILRGDIQLPYQLLAIYMQFVALCEVDDSLFIDNGNNWPKSLPSNKGWISNSKFLGYGIVMRMNNKQKKILLMSPLNKEQVKLINTIILTDIKMPFEFINEFLGPSAPMEKRSSLILPRFNNLPWFTWDEFDMVKKWIFNGSRFEMEKSTQYMLIWMKRLSDSQEDVGISGTRNVLLGLLAVNDPNIDRKWDVAQYTAAKFVTLTHINNRKKWKDFIKLEQKLPRLLIELRRNIVHGSSSISQVSCEEALALELQFIKTYYWDRSQQDLERFYSTEETEDKLTESAELDNNLKDLIKPEFLEDLVFAESSCLKRKLNINKQKLFKKIKLNKK